MNPRLVAHIFRKEGLEILRDRRTLFVNVLLPILLYPVLAIMGIQLSQVAQPGPSDWMRLAIVDGDQRLLGALPLVGPEAASELAEVDEGLLRSGEQPLSLVSLASEDADWFRQRASDLRAAEDTDSMREETVSRLRQQRLAVVLVADQDEHQRQRYTLLVDDAHPRFDIGWPVLQRQLGELRQQRLREHLSGHGLDAETVLDAQPSSTFRLAASAENLRVRLAAIIPIILVMLAISGAFMPAIDLIAGERERGTLETLLALPGDRGDMFTGKLLVVAASSIINVCLNLLSLGVTVAIIGSNLPIPGASGGSLIDPVTLALAAVMLLPLCLTLAAVCLGVAGLAASTKEAQNYLGPLFIVILAPAMAALLPTLGPSAGIDLVPILGQVLVLKEILQGPEIPWGHVILSTVSAVVVAWVVIGWSARLLEQEHFLFPGMQRGGWGIFRRPGTLQPSTPGGLEVLALFAAAMGSFLVVSVLVSGLPPGPALILAQAGGLLAPVLIHTTLGDYNREQTLFLRRPNARALGVSLALVPLAMALSIALGQVQAPFIPPSNMEELRMLEEVLNRIRAQGGIVLLLIVAAVTPGICEEFLCRGSLLSGLRRSLGPIGAIVLSSIIFGLMHMSPWRFAPQAVLGVVLAVLVLRSGSLWTAVIVHIGHNALILVLALSFGEASGADELDPLAINHPAAPLMWLGIAAFIGLIIWRLLVLLPSSPGDYGSTIKDDHHAPPDRDQ
ncbi:MAG: CPBP family intramembrane metalloprotease [Planctomycetota bacterium]|nr:MAG: CPBP family intramembrane metalloprotease [Planctomycetota bacterium]